MSSVSYHGGPLVAEIEIVSVFLDATVTSWTYPPPRRPPGWEEDAGLQWLDQEVRRFLQALTSSAYLNALGEYSAPGFRIGAGRYTESRLLITSIHFDAPQEFDTLSLQEDAIRDLLSQAIMDHRLPAPNPNTCYMIFLPPRVSLGGHRDANGYHGFSSHSGSPNIYYAVIQHPATTGANTSVYPSEALPPTWHLSADQFNDLTTVISHEIVEAVTDPSTDLSHRGTGWRTDLPPPATDNEIADLCEVNSMRSALTMGEYKLSPFWLQSQGSCFNGFLVHISLVNDGSLAECLGYPLLIEYWRCHLRAEVSNNLGVPLSRAPTFAWTVNGEPAGEGTPDFYIYPASCTAERHYWGDGDVS